MEVTLRLVGSRGILVEPILPDMADNPNDFRQSSSEVRRARDSTVLFEPGSTMKIFTVAAGLAGGAISPTQKLYCEKGVMAVDNVMIRDTHASEWLSLPQVLALSCLYTPTRLAMNDVIRVLKERGLRDKVKIIVGGAPIDQSFADMVGADGYAPDPPAGIKKVMGWLGK